MHKDEYTKRYIEVLFLMAIDQKQPSVNTVENWLNKPCSISRTEHPPALETE